MRYSVITTVTSPAGSFNLTDLATVKDELSIPTGDTANDATLTRMLGETSASIANYCNRVLVSQTYQDAFRSSRFFRWSANGGHQPLIAGNAPIVSITSVVEDGATLVAGTDYETDLLPGLLYRLDGNGSRCGWRGAIITVIYVAGYSPIPADLVGAALRWVTMMWTARGRDPMLKRREQRGGQVDMSEDFWVGGPPMSGSVPMEIVGILDNFRVPMIG